MTSTSIRVGTYTRISDDGDGRQTATARQLADCQAFAERQGWEVADQFEDVDISAYNKKATRPEFERLVVALRNGDVDGVLVWKLDRLSRQQRDLLRVMEACEAHGGFVASVTEPINTTEPYGQFIAEFLVAQARMESANQGTRLRRKARELRELGVPPWNGLRCFGYAKSYAEIIPEEAALLCEARDRLLAGDSLRGVCLDWERRDVRSSRGNQMGVTVLRRLLCSATLSGQREYEGQLFPGTWPAIFSPEDTLRLRTSFAAKRHFPTVRPARIALLAGFIRCGRCGQGMSANRRADRQRRYVCLRVPGTPGCGQMSTVAEPLEEFVAELIFAAVDDTALRDAMRARSDDDDGLLQSVQRDEAALDQLATDHYAEAILSRQEFLAARGVLTRRLETNREKLARRDRRGVLGQFVGSGETLRAAWADGTLDWRRAVVGALLDRVEVMPATEKGRKRFDTGRVKPVWRY